MSTTDLDASERILNETRERLARALARLERNVRLNQRAMESQRMEYSSITQDLDHYIKTLGSLIEEQKH